MTRIHHDQFAKQCLGGFLAPFGIVEISREISSEVRQVDVWFVPGDSSTAQLNALGVLGQMAQTPCLLEAFRNQIQATHILDCQSKLNEVRHERLRSAKSQNQRLSEAEKPRLWLISPSVSRRVLEEFSALSDSKWTEGVYFLPKGQRIGVVAINQLPVAPETLWLRLMGRDRVQSAAIAELMALPATTLFRDHALERLANLRLTIAARQNLSSDERGLIMTLSPVYEQWQAETLQQGRQEGRQEGKFELVERLLTRKVGELSPDVRSRIAGLSIAQLNELGEALLDFSSADDLAQWLEVHGMA
ncbi:MAG: DUF4351 domain-containing protein [Leptolyngbya sp. Prado105]|jgi:hypothetical protein|nr:DUF4351 domain-containing protein [Leptolyngbya sp. Prado105]